MAKESLSDTPRNELPPGFVELRCVPSGSVWHVRADSIAAYGPEERNVIDQLVGCPVQLRGQPRSESMLVDSSVRQIAQMCIAAEKACASIAPVAPGSAAINHWDVWSFPSSRESRDDCPARHEAIAPGSWCSKCGERRPLL